MATRRCATRRCKLLDAVSTILDAQLGIATAASTASGDRSDAAKGVADS